MIRCVLPWPPSSLRPNSARTRHWRANSGVAAAYKAEVAVELRQQGVGKLRSDMGNPITNRLAVTLRFCPPTRRVYDLDGSLSAFKAALDQLASTLGMDDSQFEPITLCRGGVVKGGAVEVVLTED